MEVYPKGEDTEEEEEDEGEEGAAEEEKEGEEEEEHEQGENEEKEQDGDYVVFRSPWSSFPFRLPVEIMSSPSVHDFGHPQRIGRLGRQRLRRNNVHVHGRLQQLQLCRSGVSGGSPNGTPRRLRCDALERPRPPRSLEA